MDVSAEALVRIFLLLLYGSVCAIVYRRLMPRLSTASQWLATAMLAAQALMLLVAVEWQPGSYDDWWHWHPDRENNIPSTFASAQLMLVAVVAFAAAWFGRGQPVWIRLFLTALCLFFLHLAQEELIERRHYRLGSEWIIHFTALGASVVVATLIVAARSSRRTRIWYTCLLAGLAVSAAGALVVEQLRLLETCEKFAFTHGERCLQHFYEETLETLGVWLMLVAMLGLFSEWVPKSRRVPSMILFFLPWIWALSFHGPYRIWEFEFRFLSEPASVDYETGIELRARRIKQGAKSVTVTLFTKVINWTDYSGAGFSIHLVDQATGASFASADEGASRAQSIRRYDSKSNSRHYIFKQLIAVNIPPEAPVNRAAWIVFTTWREENGEFAPQRILSSDQMLLGDTQVVFGELVLPEDSIAAAAEQLASFDHGLALGDVHLPPKAHIGDTLSIPFSWSAENDVLEDYTQFLHFIHDELGGQWGYDQQPLGARLPTRLWYSGLADTEIWQVPIPTDLAPGTYKVYTGLYRASDLERLPARDAAGKLFADARIPLGSIIIEQV
ncbi:MAG: hypothetical protein OXG84_02755 [Chloroflexi bacterium]|nr:hypothetical protein [Chloroflexota bacterium]